MFDWLRIIIVIGAITGAIALICLGCVVWANGASRNLVLAAGALAGAVVLLVTQLYFELKGSLTKDFITAEFTIDRAGPWIRAPNCGKYGSGRMRSELEAGKSVGWRNPAAFTDNREKLNVDITLYSLLLYFVWEQQDWQLSRNSFRGSGHILTETAGISKPNECSIVRAATLRDRLQDAGNLFADATGSSLNRDLCLPPGSSLQLIGNSLVVRSPLIEVWFEVVPSSGVSYTLPGPSPEAPLDAAQTQLLDGQPRYETRLVGIRVTITSSRLRAQSPEMPKYQDWAKRLVDGASEWFSTPEQPPMAKASVSD